MDHLMTPIGLAIGVGACIFVFIVAVGLLIIDRLESKKGPEPGTTAYEAQQRGMMICGSLCVTPAACKTFAALCGLGRRR